jgi:hypothetical protein
MPSPSSLSSTDAAPDLAQTARDAVVSFLRDASAATAERERGRAPDSTPAAPADLAPWSAAAAGRPDVPESAAVRAASVGIATLARIEAAAAKVEADIAAALRAHAELQAGAGEAAEAAVQAAQEAWTAAHTAVAADLSAKVSLRHVARYVSITILLLIVAIVILAVTATSVR